MSAATDRFFGGLLMAVGGLIAGLCGTCTVLFLGGGLLSFVSQLASSATARGHLGADLLGGVSLASVVAMTGGAPTAVGVLLFREGRKRYDKGRAQT